jgi:RHS repeat-associated protein
LYYNKYSTSDADYIMLDSISTKGISGANVKVAYNYQAITVTTGPFNDTMSIDEGRGICWFGGGDDMHRYVLKSVVFPGGCDTTYYDYNSFGELVGIRASAGSQTVYGYSTYGFSMPKTDETAMVTDTSYSRASDTLNIRESAVATYKTTLYQRVARTDRSNPETLIVRDPYGNETVTRFVMSGNMPPYKWCSGYGMVFETKSYNGSAATGVLVSSSKNTFNPPDGGANTRLDSTVSTVGSKTFVTKYCDYDTFCNPRRIEYKGDVSTSADDRVSYYEYLHDNKNIDVKVSGPACIRRGNTGTITTTYSGATGIVQTKLYKNGGLENSQTFSPSTSGSTYYQWNTSGLPEGVYCFFAMACDVAGNAVRTDSISIEVSVDLIPGDSDTSTVTAFASNQYDENHRHILDRVTRQWDSIPGGAKLSEVIYKYDEYGRIDSTLYDSDPPIMWDDPHFAVRGKATTVKVWKAGSLYDSSRVYYDQCGNVIKTINPKGDSSKVFYAPGGDPDKYQYALPCSSVSYATVSTYTLPLASSAEYDTFSGQTLKTWGANKDTTRYQYDDLGRLTRLYRPGEGDSAAVKKHYYDNSYPRSVVDSVKITGSSYAVSKTFYDGFGRGIQSQKRETDGKATIVNTQYDSVGQVRRVSNPIGTATTFGTYITTDYWTSQPKVTNYYDGVGRIIKTVYQDSTRDSVAYGDNWVKVWDARGDTAISRTNGFGMADTTVNGLGLLTIVKHDKMGRDSVITDASGKSTYCYYDTLGRIKGANGPDASSGYYYRGQSVDYLVEYDQLGNITKSMNAKAVVNYTYDALSRIIKVDSAGSDRVLYRYDSYYDCNYAPTDTMNAKGRITRLVTAGIDTTWFVYNKLGNLTKRVFSYAGMGGGRDSVRYAYNTAGACTSLVYPDGTNIRYTYNAIGQLTAAGDYLSSAVYNTTGQPRKIGYANLTNDSLFYDNRLRLTRLKSYYYNWDEPPARNVQHLSYTYWQDGNIKQVQDNLNSAYTQYYDYTTPSNSYDAAGRLQRCAVGSTVLTYTYDNVGNRTQETVGGTTNSFGYTSGTNKLASATVNGTSYTYTHDNTGNVTIKSWGNGEYHLFYAYDYKNMLVSVYNDITNRTVTNYYGGGGSLKVKKTDSQLGSRYYAYEGINPLCEYDSTGSVKKKYVYAFGKCIAYVDSAGNKFWLHQDALGSVKVVTNANGDTVSTYKYYPFGDSLLTRGSSKNDVQFTGKQNIAGIEAYDFSARYYDPELGRFYSIDPMGSAATSPYAYCSNNPVNRVDPTGMVDGRPTGYPPGWTNYSYSRSDAWDMYNNRGRSSMALGDVEQWGQGHSGGLHHTRAYYFGGCFTNADGKTGSVDEWFADTYKQRVEYQDKCRKQAEEKARAAAEYDPNMIYGKKGSDQNLLTAIDQAMRMWGSALMYIAQEAPYKGTTTDVFLAIDWRIEYEKKGFEPDNPRCCNQWAEGLASHLQSEGYDNFDITVTRAGLHAWVKASSEYFSFTIDPWVLATPYNPNYYYNRFIRGSK